MNIVSYNLVKFQDDHKIKTTKLAQMLNCSKKDVVKMRRQSYKFSDQEIKKIASVMFITEKELTTEMCEHINLKEKKIYGTDYLNVDYKVESFKIHNINLISAIVDLIFFITLAILLVSKQIILSLNYSPFINILKTIFIIELFVFPFMFIALPLLKIYFNRTYEATLKSKVKEYYKEEACGIIQSCLRRSINKSIIPYVFTLFSELVIAMYCLFNLIYIKAIELGYLVMIILFVISLIISIYSFKYHTKKYGTKINKGE